MAENAKLECLKMLQSVLQRKFELENKVIALPANLNAEEATLADANSKYLNLTKKYNSVNDEYKSLCIKYDEAFTNKTEYEKKMEFINTQREYEALSKQIDEAKLQEQTLLKSRNQKKAELEKLTQELDEQEKICTDQKAVVDEERTKVGGEVDTLKVEIDELDKKCLEIKGNVISDDLYSKFSNISRQKDGIGIVPVWGQVCQGCNMVLPMQFVIDLRLKQEHNELDYCPYCSRVIYYEKLDPETEKNYIFEQLEPTKDTGKSAQTGIDDKQDADAFDESMEISEGFDEL